ncbi:hypothetical protein D3C84_1085000 [compost metagenome]
MRPCIVVTYPYGFLGNMIVTNKDETITDFTGFRIWTIRVDWPTQRVLPLVLLRHPVQKKTDEYQDV